MVLHEFHLVTPTEFLRIFFSKHSTGIYLDEASGMPLENFHKILSNFFLRIRKENPETKFPAGILPENLQKLFSK